MRKCESCGDELECTGAFAVCPKCLLKTALEVHDQLEEQVDSDDAEPATRLGMAARLFPRRDFFERYELLDRVGAGGQGDIWKVWDVELRRFVAMKRLSSSALTSPTAVYRFLAEAQIASQLEHPGILPIFDVGLDPDRRPFYTTQLLPGTTLGDIWRKTRQADNEGWTVLRALEMLVRVCDVMGHAHSRGVVHRDLKPTNVLVGPFGDVRVIDWGSAHVLEGARKDFQESFVPLDQPEIETERGDALWGDPASPLSTANSGHPVTILFTPPEILAGRSQELGPQTDVYSLGVMLYDLVTGRAPYSSSDGRLPDHRELRGMILHGPPSPVRAINPSVSLDLAAICQKAMAFPRAARYVDMQELATDIRSLLSVRPVGARNPGPILKMQRWTQRHLSAVLLGASMVLVFAIGFFLTRGLQAQRDVARQVTALRSAELAARSGQWPQALEYWNEAERAGCRDSIYLDLQRAEAWTVLSQPAKAEAVFQRLLRRDDLAQQRAVVLLRLGEHELFDPLTAREGVGHVRQATQAGLTGADETCARGLLAQSTLEALSHFRQALQLNPYSHIAHRHSLGLEFLLGRHEELKAHLQLFRVLYPDDPAPAFLEATELALQGRSAEAQAVLGGMRSPANAASYQQLEPTLRKLADTASRLDPQNLLSSGRLDEGKRQEIIHAASRMFESGNVASPVKAGGSLRFPQLPCVQKGVNEGFQAVASLMIPYLSNPDVAVRKVKDCWHSHPEAWLPVLAGLMLDSRRPKEGPARLSWLATEAELFQMGADSSGAIPHLPRLGRLLAVTSQMELTRSGGTNAASARARCRENLRRAAGSLDTSAAECSAYFELAMQLDDCDTARALFAQWQRQNPEDAALAHKRVELEIASGSLGTALDLIDKLLEHDPAEPRAVAAKRTAMERLEQLLRSHSTHE